MERCERLASQDYKNLGAVSQNHVAAGETHRAVLMFTRLTFSLFMLITSAYCLLSYIPFTYKWVISFNLVWWLPAFVKFHVWLYWLVFAMLAASFRRALERQHTRRMAAGFLLFHIALGILLFFKPALPGIQNNGISFIWSLAWLFPALWLGSIDYMTEAGNVKWGGAADHDNQMLLAAVLTAGFLTGLYAWSFYVRLITNPTSHFSISEQVTAIGVSLASHLLMLALLFALLKLINTLARKLSTGAKAEFLLCHLLAVAVVALVIRRVILPAIAFNNHLADLFSVLAGFSIVVFSMGLSVSMHRNRSERVSRGLELAMTPITIPGISSVGGRIMWAAVAALFAWIVPALVAMKDWDFLLQELSAILVWPLSFAAFYQIASRFKPKQYHPAIVVLIAVSIFVAYRNSTHLKPLFSRHVSFDVSETLERYSGYDVSFRAVREIYAEASNDGDLYQYLREYTNILPATRVDPVEINLVDRLEPTEGAKPNIFIFVIDSLRQGYLSPYNKAVSFTPNIEQFARDSVVMENAFTSYGGTALSEPAIWAGSMLLHKQYILPFYPMNSLQKLVDTEGYQSFISVDPILAEILRPSPSIVELDKRTDGHNFDFCRSLDELEQKIDERESSRPIFAYSQPWNIHTHVIAVEGRAVPPGEDYPGFWAPYASRVKYMDSCLGGFLAYLKERGLYDNSIVVLSSDHGDSLGEDGRWGHSFWMYPEIIKIPLIVHLPPRLRQRSDVDSKAIAFSTDITPSLYYLLGHKPIARNGLFGRPLFTVTENERSEYARDSYVIASSYGAVYGVLSGNGRWLFLADGVRDTDYFYDLGDEGRGSPENFTAAKRAEQKQIIREYIGSLNLFYGLTEKPDTAGAFDMGWQGRPASEK
jgi:arylsulfatase A-like enzyme